MKKIASFNVLILLSFLFIHCGVRIPEVDTTPPVLTFEITIPGQDGIVISSEEEFEFIQINLHENSRYAFRYTARDEGGIRFMQMQYGNYLRLSRFASSFTDRELSPLSRMLEWQGDRDSPLNAMIAAGMMHTEPLTGTDQIGDNVTFFASDFGGRTGSSNRTIMEINITTVRAGEATGIVARY